jgi:N-6 DNA Methylase
MEETAAVPPSATNAEALVPHLKKCGYGDAQLARPFKVGEATIDVAAFAGKPWDNWSACLAVVNLDGDSKASAAKAQHLGAASVFVCGPQGVDWCGLGPKGPTVPKQFKWADVPGFFREHKAELDPRAIYNAKLRRPTATRVQMTFFDAGLMPAVERNRGETLLRLVEDAIGGLHTEFGSKLNKRQAQEDVYRTVFWQLAAKVLHDKGVPNFKQIDLKNVDQVFDRIGKHHGVTDRFPPFGVAGRSAINAMAATLARCGSLADVSSESIAYVYENALLDKAAGKGEPMRAGTPYDIRKELGIHSTPSVLIHHMLSQMWGMVEEIAPADRVVFEPACGHAPFLTGAMRWLRSWDDKGESQTDHDYMRKHVRGVEANAFAIELAKLALTLADEPHGNSWAIRLGDMFAPGVLAKEAKKARVLLSNPPYEAFTDSQKRHYAKLGEPVTANTKAVEMLKRTLPHLTAGSVFGVVMPVGVLHDKESKTVREELLKDFDLSEISVFADSLFEHGDHEVAVLMGRKKKPRGSAVSLMYRRVREGGMEAFKERLEFSWERPVPQSRFLASSDSDLRVRDIEEVWLYLREYATLGSVAVVRQGASLITGRQKTVERRGAATRPTGSVPAVVARYRDFGIYELPPTTWMYQDRRDVLHWRGGTFFDGPQVLLNYASQARKAWRLKGFYDSVGHAVTNKYTTIRPNVRGPSALALWGLMNSPVANAFAHCGSLKRHTFDGLLKGMPIPAIGAAGWSAIEQAATHYRQLAARVVADNGARPDLFNPSTPHAASTPTNAEVRDALLAMDAAVLRAYALPVRLERQLLDLFNGAERKGVGCTFGDYFPAGFKSLVPLHKYISAGDRGSTVDQVATRMKPDESSAVTAALRAAAEAFGVDQGRPERFGRALALLDKWTSENADFDARVGPQIEKALRETAPRHFPES